MNKSIFEKLQQFYYFTDFSTFLNGIEEISGLFMKIDRPSLSSDQLIELKYAMMHWRQYCKKKILTTFPCGDEKRAIDQLIALSIYLSAQDCKKLITHAPKEKLQELFLYAGQKGLYQGVGGLGGISCGPQKKLTMVSNRQVRLFPDRWMDNPDFSDYQYDGSSLIYRGIRFQQGDVILSAVNLGGNGSFTAMTEPRNCIFHSGFFVFYPYKGRIIPSVLEAYEIGIRPVPLSHFLSPTFSCYVEVFRLKELDSLNTASLGEHAKELVETTIGYNFDTEDSDLSYLACTTVGNELFKRVGISKISCKSEAVNPVVRRNVKAFGLVRNEFFFPVDFAIDNRMSFVGSIDNEMFDKSVSQELSDRLFSSAFSSGLVNFKKMPLYFTVVCYFLGQIRKRTFAGRIIGMVFGFNSETLPKGDNKAVAMIDTCALYVAHWEKKLQRFLKKEHQLDKYFNIDSFCHQYEGHKKVKKIYSGLRKWFSKEVVDE